MTRSRVRVGARFFCASAGGESPPSLTPSFFAMRSSTSSRALLSTTVRVAADQSIPTAGSTIVPDSANGSSTRLLREFQNALPARLSSALIEPLTSSEKTTWRLPASP